jgi:hypothetical protein
MTCRVNDESTTPVVIRAHHLHMKRSARIPLWTRQAFGQPHRPHTIV